VDGAAGVQQEEVEVSHPSDVGRITVIPYPTPGAAL